MDILEGRNRTATRARGFVCHIVRNSYPHLINPLCESTSRTKAAIMVLAESMEERIMGNIGMRVLMNEIRTALKLPKIKPNPQACNISATKTLFGFDYTEDEAQNRMAFAFLADKYMKKLCSIGRRPLEDGKVFSPVRAKRQYSAWYNA